MRLLLYVEQCCTRLLLILLIALPHQATADSASFCCCCCCCVLVAVLCCDMSVVSSSAAGCVMSLGALGFLLLLLSSHKQRTVTAAAALVSSVPVFVAVAALLSQPAWVSQGSARVAADSLQGLAAGYNLLVLLVLLLPAVKRWGPKAVAAGAWGGAATGLVVCAGVAGLCLGTPYCLHVHSTVAASL
jgi:hypothetical protein